ncbi:MAG: MFS transporter [Desulfobacterales bacterium]|nr:MFS transporter [Desulfobacterales bacterium]
MITRNIIVVFLLSFLANLGYGVMIPSLALYASSLGASRSFIGIIVSTFAAAQLVTQIPVGRLADRVGRKYLIVAGFAGVAIASALYNFAGHFSQFLVLQGLAGLSMGFVWPPLMALLTDEVAPSERGKLMGIYNTIFFIGIGTGPMFGGMIATAYGYRPVFNVWAALELIAALIAWAALKDRVRQPVARTAGSVRVRNRGVSLLKPGFWLTFVAGCAIRTRGGFCTSFNNSLLPLYAVMLFDASPRMIGNLMLTHGLGLAFFNLPGGLLSDRFGRRLPSLLGSLIATVGVFGYSLAGSFWPLLLAVGLAGAGAALASPAVAALTADVCTPERRGEAFGYFLTSHHIGMVFGALIFGFVSDWVGLPGAVLAWGITSFLVSTTSWFIREDSALQTAQPVFSGSSGNR